MLRLTLLAALAFGCHPTPSTGPGPGLEPTPTPAPTTGSATTTTTTTTECAKDRCGPALGMKSTPCSDGSIGGPTGRCIEHEDKTCGWEIRSCP